MEEAQRERRKKNPEHDHQPKWFNKVSKEEGVYSYRGGYWEQRLTGKFADLPDIFEYELDRGTPVVSTSGLSGSGGSLPSSSSQNNLPQGSQPSPAPSLASSGSSMSLSEVRHEFPFI